MGDPEPENDQVVSQPNNQKGFLGPSQRKETVTLRCQSCLLAELSETDLGNVVLFNNNNNKIEIYDALDLKEKGLVFREFQTVE